MVASQCTPCGELACSIAYRLPL